MIHIYKTLRKIYESWFLTKQIDGWSEDYEKGYRHCLSLLLLAIEQHPALNIHVEYMRLEIRSREERDKLLKEVDRLQRQLKEKHELNQRLRELLNLESQGSLKRMIFSLQTQLDQLRQIATQADNVVISPENNVESVASLQTHSKISYEYTE